MDNLRILWISNLVQGLTLILLSAEFPDDCNQMMHAFMKILTETYRFVICKCHRWNLFGKLFKEGFHELKH